MGWSQRLRADADSIWREIVAHPFLTELGAGTLAPERFRFFMAQDYPYLKEFARVLALAVARGGRLAEMSFFAELLHGTLNVEMALHRSYCAEFGLTEAEIMASLVPCMVTYPEIGKRLAVSPPKNAPLYVRWIDTYASDAFQEIARRVEEAFDRLEPLAGPEEAVRCHDHYMKSFRYEWMFWEMAYRMEPWLPQGSRR